MLLCMEQFKRVRFDLSRDANFDSLSMSSAEAVFSGVPANLYFEEATLMDRTGRRELLIGTGAALIFCFAVSWSAGYGLSRYLGLHAF